MGVIRGALPAWTEESISGSGDGDGSGSGSGDGDGYGFGSGSGFGFGSGYGSGSGYGYGDGYGDGYGFGYGYGSGYGYGYGDGYGFGDSYGYGCGDGSGYGSGYGFGDSYGDGYWLHAFRSSTATWNAAQRISLARAEIEADCIAFWRSNERGEASNGGGAIMPAAPGVVHESPGPLQLCSAGTLHATMKPEKWKGSRLWVVALYGEVVSDGEKFGALKREIIGEVLNAE